MNLHGTYYVFFIHSVTYLEQFIHSVTVEAIVFLHLACRGILCIKHRVLVNLIGDDDNATFYVCTTDGW